MIKDYYSILEIDPKASEEEIKKAYRALAFQCHPDRNPDDPAATEKFKKITEAYAVLMDPSKRRQYDDFLFTAQTRRDAPEPQFAYTQEEIFRDLFNNPILYNFLNELGKDFGKSGVRFGPSLFENVFFRQGGVFFAGAIFGAFNPLGRAYKLYNFFKMAQTAHGIYKQYQQAQGGTPREVPEATPKSSGTLKKKVQALFGKKDHAREQHLFFRLRVSLKEAAEGTEKTLAFTIDGREERLKVKIPPATRGGTQLRLKGKGARIGDGEKRSDLFLVIEVE